MLLSIDIGIDPVIFSNWGIEVTWHGLFTALGVIIGVAVATAFARREGYQEDTIYNVALCLASQNKFPEAIVALDDLQERFPKSTAVADSAVLRGQIYHCCNELDKAQKVLREYVDKYPANGHIQEVENLLSAMGAEGGK